MSEAKCLDCGLPYEEFPMDMLLPRAQWLEIHPSEHGLLCAACIVKRAAKVSGATVVHAVIERSPRRMPISLEFDFTNRVQAFGMTEFSDEPNAVTKITVNMAAILWCAAQNPDCQWKDMVDDTLLHELLHVVQEATGRLLHEEEVERSVLAARDVDPASLPDTPQDLDTFLTALGRAERAEVRVRELESIARDVLALIRDSEGEDLSALIAKAEQAVL